VKKIMRWIGRKRYDTYKQQYLTQKSTVDITDWRIILFGANNHERLREAEGLYILVGQVTFFIPFITTKQFLDFFYDTKLKDKVYLEAYHLYTHVDQPICFKCYGSGKRDWVSTITNSFIKGKFVRDENVLYQYRFNKNLISPDLFLSRVKLDKGDTFCQNCMGTGVLLDARFRFLSGFIKPKQRIKIYPSEEVYKNVIKYDNLVKLEKEKEYART